MKKPEVYLDMDGVLADFFTEYAKLAGIKNGNYRDIPPAKTDPTLQKMVGTDFFARLPKFPSADDLVSLVVKMFGHYHICSSPLRGDHENAEHQKKVWIKQHLNPQPTEIIITPNKAKWAVQPDGTPNILIDDRGSNITAWEAKGGIGIKYQADEDSLQTVVNGLSRAMKIIKGEEQHQPQQLKSLDRSTGQHVTHSGHTDDHKAEVKEWATAGATSAGSIASVGQSPHVVLGRSRGQKSYTGTPGRSGTKAPAQPKPKKQSPKDNALDMKGKGNLIT